jgi:hypothetical protein
MAPFDEKQTRDEIVQEVRRIKETLAESKDFDIDRIVNDARQKQQESGRMVISPAVRQGTP